MHKKRKIFFCIGSMGFGGAERVISNLANYFIEQNNVTIIETKPIAPKYKLNDKIKLIPLDEKSNPGHILKRTYKRIKKLRKILKIEKPDIVISFLPEPSYRLMVAKTLIPVRTIVSVRNDPNREYNNPAKKILAKILYSRADWLVFQTPEVQNWFPKNIQKKSTVIPNPIDDYFLREPFTGTREKKIVTVGRLVEQKNHKLLIDAFAKFHKKHPDYVLEIYGDGPLKNKLQSHIDEINLNNTVKLMGNISDIKKAIYKASVFVLTSNYEGMPNALMEAMALGVPCISTDCSGGGAKYLIDSNRNGILVNTGSLDELSDSMLLIINNKKVSTELSLSAHNYMHNLRSPKILNEWHGIIERSIQ